MIVQRGRPRSKGRPHTTLSRANDSTPNPIGRRDELTGLHTSVDEFTFECPSCEKVNTARIGSNGTWMVACFKCGLDYVDRLDCSTAVLLEDAPRVLAPFTTLYNHADDDREPEPLPTEADVRRWREALHGSDYLLRERGLTRETVERFELGWDRVYGGFTYPIRDGSGALVNVSWRAKRGAKLRLPGGARRAKHRLRGRTVASGSLPLYPQPLPPRGGLLVEGEPDALLARQHGLPAFTGLIGKTWSEAWDGYAAGRVIAVAYDVGAEEDAERTASKLRAAGARQAWVVPLGLPCEGDDLGDWFLTYDRSAAELLDLIRARRA